MAMPSTPGEYVWDREGEILRCPWHGWEFDLTTGRSIFNPHKLRVRTYEVTVEPLPNSGAGSGDAQASPATAQASGERASDRGSTGDGSSAVNDGPAPDVEDAEDERVETFPVTVEDGWVILHA
jgi:nitrite reductase/ring-hydroxylating ferredoxin subunit